LIQGLPGQTVDSWRNTLREISKHDLMLQIFISELLPASPAARDKSYQEKFKFVYCTSTRFNGDSYFEATFPESCVSFTKKDFVKMTVISHIYSALTLFRQQSIVVFDLEKAVDEFLASPMCKLVEENLYNNWVNHNKFYYTTTFDGKPLIDRDAITACYFFITGSIWTRNFKFLTLIAKHLTPGPITPSQFIKDSIVKNNKSLNVKVKQLTGYE
jgi:hypothetical protein